MTDLTPDELAARIAKLPAWARKHIAEREEYIVTLETLTRTLHAQLTEALKDNPARSASALPEGITPPTSDYATLRVYGPGDPGEPIADLPEKSALLAAGFYVVRYGYTDKVVTATSERMLSVKGGGPLTVYWPAPDEILIGRG